MYEVKKKIGKVLTSKSVRSGYSAYEKRIYRAAVSHRLSNTGIRILTKLVTLPDTNPDAVYTGPT
jgi:hypothetical protein